MFDDADPLDGTFDAPPQVGAHQEPRSAAHAPVAAAARRAELDKSERATAPDRRQLKVPDVALSHPSEKPTAPPPDDHRALVEGDIPRATSVKSFLLSTEVKAAQSEPPRSELPRTTCEPLSLLDRARRSAKPAQRREILGGAPPSLSGRFESELPKSESSPVQDMKDRFAMGDFSGSLEIAEKLLSSEPFHKEARSIADKSREVLFDMYASRIDGMDRPLQIIMGPDQIRWLSMDHRAGFLLSMVDGSMSADDLLDVSGMPRLDALRLLCGLIEQKVIALGR